jgi:hypothetical protein
MKLLESIAGIKRGTFRVIRQDIDDNYSVTADNITSENVAIATQIDFEHREKINNGNNIFSSKFYVFDDKGIVIYPKINDTGGEI